MVNLKGNAKNIFFLAIAAGLSIAAAFTLATQAKATEMDCSKRQPDLAWAEKCRLQDRENQGSSTSNNNNNDNRSNSAANAAAQAGALNLNEIDQRQLTNQVLNNQIQLSPQQRQELLNQNNISPELKAALENTNDINTDNSNANSASANNQGINIDGNSYWYFQPATAYATEVTPGVFQFRGYSGEFVQCPTPADSFSLSIYVAAFAQNHTSENVSSFCEGVTGYIQDMSRIAGATSLLPVLPVTEQQMVARATITHLLSQVGITNLNWSPVTTEVNYRQTIIIVPSQPQTNTEVDEPN